MGFTSHQKCVALQQINLDDPENRPHKDHVALQQATGLSGRALTCTEHGKVYDMTKAKTAGEKATATAEYAMANGADAVKAGFEKALKGYDAVIGFNKDT